MLYHSGKASKQEYLYPNIRLLLLKNLEFYAIFKNLAIAMVMIVQTPLLSFYCMPGDIAEDRDHNLAFIHSFFIMYSLSPYYVPVTTLVAKDTELNETTASKKK